MTEVKDKEEVQVQEMSLTKKLFSEADNIVDEAIQTSDPDKIKDLTQMFKLSQTKKDLVRANKLSKLLEVIDDEIIMRFTSTPDSFENETLLKYMQSTQNAVQNISQNINQVPTIQINNNMNEIHINNSGLNRDSRAKVLDVVNAILNASTTQQDVIDVDVNEKGD